MVRILTIAALAGIAGFCLTLSHWTPWLLTEQGAALYYHDVRKSGPPYMMALRTGAGFAGLAAAIALIVRGPS